MLIFILFFVTLCAILGFYIGYKLLHPQRYPVLETFQKQYESGFIPEEFLKKERVLFKIPSDYGYDISGFYFPGTSNQTVIFHHGIAWTKFGSAKYSKYFFDNGWNIVMYDQRSSGETGGKYPSYGYYEKRDLQKIIEFIYKKFPNTKTLGLFGESFGGALSLQGISVIPNLSFVIAVCPFTSLSGLVSHHLRLVKIPNFLHWLILPFVDLYLKLVGNFSLSNINPEMDALVSKLPILLIHGEKDFLVPVQMLEELYKKRNYLAPTQLYIFPKSGHTPELYLENKKEFDKIVKEFLDSLADISESKRVIVQMND